MSDVYVGLNYLKIFGLAIPASITCHLLFNTEVDFYGYDGGEFVYVLNNRID